MQPFDHDFDWQRALLPQIKRILAEHLVDEAPAEEDAFHNTDLIVLRMKAIRIACRLRRYDYLHRYPDEFTIRSSRPRTGNETELPKVLRGWGDYIFYGFATPACDDLAAWLLGDLGEFRLWHHRYLSTNGGRQPGTEQRNGDASSTFRAYRIGDLPPAFVIERQRERVAA